MLDILITSRVRRKLVIVFARYPDFKAHVRGIAKLIKEDAGNIQRELKNLHQSGFVKVESEGNTKVYSANTDFYAYDELQSIVEKSAKVKEEAKAKAQAEREERAAEMVAA